MALEKKPWRQQLLKQTESNAKEKNQMPIFGRVIDYHPVASICNCIRHQGDKINENTWHSVDIEVLIFTKKQLFYDVPILEKAGGLDASPPACGDRALVVFLHGDFLTPVVIGWMNNLKSIPYVHHSPLILRERGFYS